MIDKALKEFGIISKNKEIYYQAFTHQTFANENNYNYNYQRLEFVGDALIDSYVGLYLFNNYPKLNEGQMTLLRSNCVNKEALAKFSRSLNLGELLRVGNNSNELKDNEGILADLFESFSAAIYIDIGEIGLLGLLEATVFKMIDKLSNNELKDPKTLLQELLQTESRKSIKYKSHPLNDGKLFEATVTHDNIVFGKGSGITKKDAEQEAAKSALKKLQGGD
ncbi:MAG: ribonuclease III [Mycoplasma sp.]|nr:ribonuclease III [Mycoplasma sp.]